MEPSLARFRNLAAPYSALSDGAVHLLEEFLGVVAGVYDAVILAEEFFAGVLTDGAELVIDISDASLHVGHSHNGVLIESEFLVGQILPRNLAGGGQTLLQCVLRLLQCFDRRLKVGELIKRGLPLRQSFLESLYGRLALDKRDFHIDSHLKHPRDLGLSPPEPVRSSVPQVSILRPGIVRASMQEI